MTEPLAHLRLPDLPEANESLIAAPWTARLLDPDATDWAAEGRRFLVALGLASLYGVAIGLRRGGASVLVHAAGVPAGILGVCAFAVPALAILLALANVSIEALGIARAAVRGAATAALVLAGTAPAAALFAVTVEDDLSAALLACGALLLAGALAARSFIHSLAERTDVSEPRARQFAGTALLLFIAFAAVLCARIWWVTLPVVRGLT